MFHCEEIPLSSGFCIFHDISFLDINNPNYQSNVQRVKKEFYSKFEKFLDGENDLLFIGYILPDLELPNTKVLGNLYFMYSKFKGRLNFQDSTFVKKVTFNSARFENEVSFRNCTFKSKVEFDNAWFYKVTSFYNIEFGNETSYHSTVFLDEVVFNGDKFKKHAEFGYVKFHKAVDFQGAIFEDSAHFQNSEFMQVGNFDGTSFSSILLFNVTKSKCLYLSNATISELILSHANVDLCQFWQSKIKNQADFSHSNFKHVDFRRCQILDFADFSNTSFETADFSYSLFSKNAHFVETKFESNAFFNYARFERPTEIIFQRTDLSRVSFVNTDISRIHFGENIIFGADKFTIFDEKRLINYKDYQKENKQSKVNLGNVLATYRSLRENYEFRLRYDEAGKFFMKEMELRRNYEETEKGLEKQSWTKRNAFPIGLYFHLSTYGENEVKPLTGLAILFVISFSAWFIYSSGIYERLVYQIANLISMSTGAINWDGIKVVEGIRLGFERAMSNFFQVNNESTFFDYIIRIGLVLELGLLFIALRRKFERRFRH